MIRITASGVEVVILSGQSDRVRVLAPGSSVSVVPPTDLTYGSDVSVPADDTASVGMEGHQTGWRFGPPPAQMHMLVCTDSALHNADDNLDGEGSDDERLAKAENGIRVPSQPDALVSVVAQVDPTEENHLIYVWNRRERMSRCS